MTHCTDIPTWVRRFVGIPFTPGGRGESGVDCWGLVRLVYMRQFGVILASHEGAYTSTEDDAAIGAIVEHELSREVAAWTPTTAPRVGDVVLMRTGGHWHAGVWVAPGRILHARRGADSCVERFDGPVRFGRVVAVYRHSGPIVVRGRTRPFDAPVIHAAVPAGVTVREAIAGAGLDAAGLRVFLGDQEVPVDAWDRVRPRPGRTLLVTAVPAGGDGGDGKSPARVIAGIAIIAAAAAAPGALGVTSAMGAALLSAGVGLAGSLAIAALIPTRRPKIADALDRPSHSITGGRNEARAFAPVPVILGLHRVAPLYGAAPYTEIVGDDQYLRMLFVVGRGPLEISEHRIGDTPLESFEGVEIEVREGREDDDPLALYPGTVIEEPLAVLLTAIGGWVTRTSAVDADELSIDLAFLSGLLRLTRSGARAIAQVNLEVEYSPAGQNDWRRINGASPEFSRGLDLMFREPEAVFGGASTPNNPNTNIPRVAWGLGFPDAKPSYLPTTGYAWEAEGYILIRTAGIHRFGIDSSDAADLMIDGQMVATWYGEHGTLGGGTPDYEAHSGPIWLNIGFHRIRVRMECRTTTGAIAVGMQQPNSEIWQTIPHQDFRAGSQSGSPPGLRWRWFDTSVYVASINVAANRTDQIRRNLSWAVERGQYDVRVRRLTADATDPSVVDLVHWTALRTIRSDEPIRLSGLARVAMRIRATDQLAGVVDQYNCLAQSILPAYNADEKQWEEQATSSPASAYRAVLEGRGNARPIDVARIDLDELAAWSEDCRIKGLEYNAVIDTDGTVFERLSDIAAVGRASPAVRDGLYGVARDRKLTVPVQHFTPRNMRGFTGRRLLLDVPHALRCRFLNRDRDYQPDERIVYADGYSELGLEPGTARATRFEVLDLHGITSGDQAYKAGRYHLASMILRPEIFEGSTDVEHLACTRGDLVVISHDVPLLGLASGRITGLALDGAGNLHGIHVDEVCIVGEAGEHSVRVRLDSGDSFVRPVVNGPGPTQTLTFGHPVAPQDPRPKVGDLFSFGITGIETREVIVKRIEMERDFGAKLTFVDHAPGVHDADTGPIPPWTSGINQPPAWNNRPATPEIESIRSDDFVLVRGVGGELIPSMVITLRRPSSNHPQPTHAQVRTRPKPAGATPPTGPFTSHPPQALEDRSVRVTPVEQGVTYQIRLRVITAAGAVSDWVEAEHTVIGKSLPPPDVLSFECVRLSDGTRRFSWDLGEFPPDVAGVAIRYGPGGLGRTWAQLQPLHTGVLEGASPLELNVPPAGLWTLAIKMVDTSGLESINAVHIDRRLGAARQEGVAVSDDAGADGWPGTKTDCYVSNDGFLWAVGRETWDTLTWPYNINTWNAWWSWTVDPISPIVYTHTTIDAGVILDVEPGVHAIVDGDLLSEVQWSEDDVVYTDWTNLAAVAGMTVRGRYFRFRATVSATAAHRIPVIRELVLQLRAPTVTQDLQDVDTAALAATRRFGPGDVRLPISPAMFHVIRGVSVSFNGTGAGWTWEVVDKDLAGPRVRLYAPGGVLQDAVIDAQVRGLGVAQ